MNHRVALEETYGACLTDLWHLLAHLRLPVIIPGSTYFLLLCKGTHFQRFYSKQSTFYSRALVIYAHFTHEDNTSKSLSVQKSGGQTDIKNDVRLAAPQSCVKGFTCFSWLWPASLEVWQAYKQALKIITLWHTASSRSCLPDGWNSRQWDNPSHLHKGWQHETPLLWMSHADRDGT